MEARVRSFATRFTDLPTEVLGIICRSLRLTDRVCLSITCRTLLHGLASSEDAWGTLRFTRDKLSEKLPSPLAWLAHRRQGLRRLALGYCSPDDGQYNASEDDTWQGAAQLAVCLEGSPLVQLKLSYLELFGEECTAALQRLGSCTALTGLELSSCRLNCLPGVLELLPALAKLSLAWNELGGAEWGRLRQLTSLTQLDVTHCLLANLPEELAALPAMAELDLSYNELGGGSWGPLRQLTALTRLKVAGCELAALPAELAVLPALATLDLQQNWQFGAAAEEAWAPLAQCSRLTCLVLKYTPRRCLAPALVALAPHLVELDLTGRGHQHLWGSGTTNGPICRLTGLTRLSLYLSLEDSFLPETLSCLVGLQSLDLGYNSSLGKELALRPLCHLTALTQLSVNGCSLEDVPEEITHLQALKHLEIGNNPLTCWGVSWQRLCRLTAITHLNLEECLLERLPHELAELPSLTELIMYLNRHMGQGATGGAEWAALEQLTALTCLDASFCCMPAVPAVFAALHRLQVLRLGDNPSLGRGGVEVLRPLVQMTTLRHLDLSRSCLPRELEVDAIPFPLHRLEGWAERTKGLTEEEIEMLKLG